MKKNIFVLLACLLAAQLSFSQRGAEALEGNYPLNERYMLLKSKSSNYQDYKVIKETVLDGFWKIIRDSIAAKEAALAARQQNINKLNTELAQTIATLKEKEASMTEVVHDSTHITVLGIDFSKGVFLTTIAVIIIALILFVAFSSWRLKSINHAMHDRVDAFNTLNNEFEEYKRKAMEKQTKLSRELQNERNRLSEMRGM